MIFLYIYHIPESSGTVNSKIESKSNSESAIGALIISNNKLLGGEETLTYTGGSSTPIMTRKKKSKSTAKSSDSFSNFDGMNR